jgi:UDPglucose--hexose-1-phosphate uridylyltransferase
MPKTNSEIRKDYFLNKYVIIAPGRAKRPRDITVKTVIKETPCVFCPQNIDHDRSLDKIPGKKSWQTLALKNIYPAVALNNPAAYGVQEVIVETPDHGTEMFEFTSEKIKQILGFYAKRTAAISKNKKINYILVFKNNGSKAGASLSHSHSQIFATAITPPDVLAELTAAENYKTEHGVCPYCEIIKKEKNGKRLIYKDKLITVIAPYASEYRYEAWLLPNRHLDNITRLNGQELASFAHSIKKILTKLHSIGLAYNLFLHQTVSNDNQHFYLKIQPRSSVWAGVELGSGLIINSVAPEAAAKFYRG